MEIELDEQQRRLVYAVTFVLGTVVGLVVLGLVLPWQKVEQYERIQAHNPSAKPVEPFNDVLGVADNQSSNIENLLMDYSNDVVVPSNNYIEEKLREVTKPSKIEDTNLKKVKERQKLVEEQRKKLLFELKVEQVQSFYARYKAPLYGNARDFVQAAEAYQLDYRLLPAISIVESGGGKHLFKRYNPFGWGSRSFNSFEEAIFYVAQKMRVYYYDLGWKDPKKIAYKYNGPTPEAWGRKVSYLMSLMRPESELRKIADQQIQ